MTSGRLLSLNEVLEALEQRPLETDINITGLALDSRKLLGGELFLAVPGFSSDGRDFIEQAIETGAAAVLAESHGFDSCLSSSAKKKTVFIDGLRDKVAFIADRVFRQPARQLDLIGVTGTNGKTSCCWFISQLLSKLGKPCAVMGTIGQGVPPELQPCLNTTSDAVATHRFMADLVDEGVPAMAMEVSSHGLDQGRVAEMSFKIGVFTNLSRDHLDYHQTMAAYAEAKSRLFSEGRLQYAVINLDDDFSEKMVDSCPDQTQVYTFSIRTSSADIFADQVELDAGGVSAFLKTPWGNSSLRIHQMGRFSLDNMLAVIGAVCCQGFSLAEVLKHIPILLSVPGRMQRLGGGDRPLVIVDYAHTPDALSNVLASLQEHGAEKLICVFGCGGDRDRGKRPLMAEAAALGSHQIVITSDNPRTESPEQIIEDTCAGVPQGKRKQVICIVNRAEAIQYAVSQAKTGDIVLIAGKGHEDYQEINGQRMHFDDVVQAGKALKHWQSRPVMEVRS